MTSIDAQELLVARVRLPQHVVHRAFVSETVVLNLRTGQYHGLNPTAGRMLDAINASSSIGAAIPELAGEYGIDPEQIERDLLELCHGLLDRDLIEIVDDERTR
jgi:hypothetical protein